MTGDNFYKGFWITTPVGNNAFSFGKRENRKIYVPPVLPGSPADLKIGDNIVFGEIEDGKERNVCGLQNFIQFDFHNKPVFVFDNHNHAFFFWLLGLTQGKIAKDGLLVHVDQHTDMREPASYLEVTGSQIKLSQVFEYTNFVLNVGNFIKPALKLGLFSEVQIVDSQTGFEREFPPGYVLDLDMDIFSHDMRYIPEDYKKQRIKEYIVGATFITVATSPYFMPQEKALSVLRELFGVFQHK